MHIVFEQKPTTDNDNFSALISRFNLCKNNSYKIFDILKQELEIKYEIIEQSTEEISKLIRTAQYKKAIIQLEFLEEFVFSLRRNVY